MQFDMHCSEKCQLYIALWSMRVAEDGVLLWKKQQPFSGDVAEKPFYIKCAAFTKPGINR